MTLKTVQVPANLAPIFERAETIVSRYFAERRHDPEHGTIEIFGERYILVRAAALSVEFFALVASLFGPEREADAEAFAQSVLFDLAHAIGKSDAATFHARIGLDDPLDRLSAGPVHFAHAGWAKVDISAESLAVEGNDFHMTYDHPYSFESDAWMRAGKARRQPACVMNAGYSSGWGEASFGLPLVAVEVLCRARGDEACRFIMAPPERIGARVDAFRQRRSGALGVGDLPIPAFFGRTLVEEELRRSRDELERRVVERTAELTRANERLVREMKERERAEARLLQTYKLEAIGRLAGGVAHDFNNLMAIIAVNCDLLGRTMAPGGPSSVYLEDIAAAAARAATLTRQLLAFSRAEPAARARLDMNRVVGELGRLLERVIGEDVSLVMRLGDGIGVIEADRGQVEQILMNLVVNARDAMPGGGTLTVETRAVEIDQVRADELNAGAGGAGALSAGPHAVLSVKDTGSGMDKATLEKIFDPFFTTKDTGQGTGLGLATVYGIVRQSGGAIVVESAPGRGTELTIYLPVAGKSSPSAPATIPPAMHEPRAATGTVLIVEDQPRLLDVIGTVLGSLGYEVLSAHDGKEALRIAGDHPGSIDLLLTDVVMPWLSGPELAKRMRLLLPELAVLFMSGYAPEVMRGHTGLEDVRILAKPFSPEDLEREVAASLAARALGAGKAS